MFKIFIKLVTKIIWCIGIITFISCNIINAFADDMNGWIYSENKDEYSGGKVSAWNYYENGKPKEGWFNVDNKWYYGDIKHEDSYHGIYINSWAPIYSYEYIDENNISHIEYGGYDRYCGEDGAMKIGWFKAYARSDYEKNGKLNWYYAGEDGIILKNQYTKDGYYVNEEGICENI